MGFSKVLHCDLLCGVCIQQLLIGVLLFKYLALFLLIVIRHVYPTQFMLLKNMDDLDLLLVNNYLTPELFPVSQ